MFGPNSSNSRWSILQLLAYNLPSYSAIFVEIYFLVDTFGSNSRASPEAQIPVFWGVVFSVPFILGGMIFSLSRVEELKILSLFINMFVAFLVAGCLGLASSVLGAASLFVYCPIFICGIWKTLSELKRHRHTSRLDDLTDEGGERGGWDQAPNSQSSEVVQRDVRREKEGGTDKSGRGGK